MNILPKKRWHVRTKDNVARVRRDQAKAREEEKSRQERAALAEQEARTSLLRQRAATQRQREGEFQQTTLPSTSVDPPQREGHINFFADLEEQERTFGVNKEHEREKRLEKEAEERKIGLLKYLGEGSSEYTKETPWYQKVPKREVVEAKSTSSAFIRQSAGPRPKVESKSKDEKQRSKDRKKKKRRRSRSSSSEESSSSDDGISNKKKKQLDAAVDIEKLRADRLRREREERLRAEAVLRRMKGEREETAKTKEQPPQYQRRYNSQFNPDLARQNRND